MKLILIILFLDFHFNSYSQVVIKAEQAKQYVGKEVFLQGKVVGTKLFTNKEGHKVLFINLEEPYPDSPATIVIFDEVLKQIKYSKSQLQNQIVTIKGEVTLYKGKSQVILTGFSKFLMV